MGPTTSLPVSLSITRPPMGIDSKANGVQHSNGTGPERSRSGGEIKADQLGGLTVNSKTDLYCVIVHDCERNSPAAVICHYRETNHHVPASLRWLTTCAAQ